MRYTESKEESLALLRHVLVHTGALDAALTPICFAVLYEHVSGTNPRLSEAFEAARRENARLDDAAIGRLYRDFVAEPGDEEAERIRGEMQKVMSTIAHSAAETNREAGRFGQQLDGLGGALERADPKDLRTQMEVTRQGTREMQSAVHVLQTQVVDGQREINRLRTELVRIRNEALLCTITRVLNRRGFDERLSAMLSTPAAKGTAHCVVLIDIDHFKRVNDAHGHLVGDRVIAGLGEILRGLPQEPGMACARYGGEEFAVLLPHSTLTRAAQVAELVRARTRGMRIKHRGSQDVLTQVTVSAGVAAWQPGEDATAFLACADRALYRSKESGRDRVTVA
jgi:diguanylate cyclase